MPALCAYIDQQNISLLLFESTEKYTTKNFPYVYSHAIFSSSFTHDDFLIALFTLFCKENKIKLADCDILVTGYMEPPELLMSLKISEPVYSVIKNIEGVDLCLVNNTGILGRNFCYSFTNIAKGQLNAQIEVPESVESVEENFYGNSQIYPNLLPMYITTQLDIDESITSMFPNTTVFTGEKPVVFSGGRFVQGTIHPELDYLLMLNLIKNPGVFDIRRDNSNFAVLFSLLQKFHPDLQLDNAYVKEGTLINTPGTVECMIKSDFGTSRLLQFDKDTINVVPVGHDERVQIIVKSHALGTVEKYVNGGRLGLIFDTRSQKTMNKVNLSAFSTGIKSFKEALGN